MKPIRLVLAGICCSLALLAGCGGGGAQSGGNIAEGGGSPETTPSAERSGKDGADGEKDNEKNGTGGEKDNEKDGADGEKDGTDEGGRTAGDVYVFNTYRAEQGEDDQRPKGLTASEFTSFTGLEWQKWTGESAMAKGDMSGTWCLPECRSRPYHVTVRLGAPEEIGGTTYYTRFSLADATQLPAKMRQRFEKAEGISEDGSGTLMRPSGDG